MVIEDAYNYYLTLFIIIFYKLKLFIISNLSNLPPHTPK